ncbi:hypothetical protein THAOC_32837 [Thalassiosira oceanica]|uniref:Uncharacterized protein n=1 Tax=Thalassiosira oceanica TaxID=159749 RepID=K0RNP0_THAOC|nr:hypothetical protein THAOC_32837 [Thalassiosira oceanica]|eukprot:EJK48372.1 hypothetical protein THAOC_32837 [Thalassiosira oceanica]
MTEKKEEMQVDEPKLADEPDAEPTAEAGGAGRSPGSGGPAAPTLALPLPALRPEEPAASLRAALSDIVGFAHVTRYRLAVEGIDGGTRDGFVSNDVPANGKTNGSQHPPGGQERPVEEGTEEEVQREPVVERRPPGSRVAVHRPGRRDRAGFVAGRRGTRPRPDGTGRRREQARAGHQRRCQDGRDRGEGEGRDGPPVARRVLRPRLPRGPVPFRPVHGRGHARPLRARGPTRRAAAAGHRRRVVVRDTRGPGAVRRGIREGTRAPRPDSAAGGAPHLRAVLSEEEVAEARAAARAKGDGKEGGEEKKEAENGLAKAPSIHAPPFPRRQDACPARYHQEARALKRDEVPSIPSGVLGPPRRALSIRGLRSAPPPPRRVTIENPPGCPDWSAPLTLQERPRGRYSRDAPLGGSPGVSSPRRASTRRCCRNWTKSSFP